MIPVDMLSICSVYGGLCENMFHVHLLMRECYSEAKLNDQSMRWLNYLFNMTLFFKGAN